jgi:iron complex transport system ATP-binding protein
MSPPSLVINNLVAGYGDTQILNGVTFEIPPAQITAIVGANACGKSTLLKAMSRLITPVSGTVTLDGTALHQIKPKHLARKLGLLPQSPIAPEGISVLDLVSRGRHPHHGIFARWTKQDEVAVVDALNATRTSDLAERMVSDLSGGQRQRVWIAMALAQDTDILLLDEPTTFLDINHQIEVLDLLTDLNQKRGTTIVMVLHDLNLAARYADCLVAIAQGQIHANGSAKDVLTAKNMHHVFGLDSQIIPDPISGKPMMIPRGRHGITRTKQPHIIQGEISA